MVRQKPLMIERKCSVSSGSVKIGPFCSGSPPKLGTREAEASSAKADISERSNDKLARRIKKSKTNEEDIVVLFFFGSLLHSDCASDSQYCETSGCIFPNVINQTSTHFNKINSLQCSLPSSFLFFFDFSSS